MHLDAQIIEGFLTRRIRLSPEESEHLHDCIPCRSALQNASTHIDPKRLFDLAQMDVIFEEAEWPHLSACDRCASRFTDFLKLRVDEEKKISGK